jgi:hypothetical protein
LQKSISIDYNLFIIINGIGGLGIRGRISFFYPGCVDCLPMLHC